jgi:drug/metabolite transporter (DMT)-like permease
MFRSVGMALLAGAGFGAFFVFLSRTPSQHSLWPLVWARCASLTLLLVVALARRVSPVLSGRPARLALLSGALDMSSSALFLIAVKHGSLAVVGLLSSLYPISTVLLASVVLKERIRRIQHLGVTLAVMSVFLLAWN